MGIQYNILEFMADLATGGYRLELQTDCEQMPSLVLREAGVSWTCEVYTMIRKGDLGVDFSTQELEILEVHEITFDMAKVKSLPSEDLLPLMKITDGRLFALTALQTDEKMVTFSRIVRRYGRAWQV